jgi:ribosomal protein S18 acetylase RimI-like enzyme
MSEISIRTVEDAELSATYQLLHELRNHLDNLTFVSRLRRQIEQGYRLCRAFCGSLLVGLIGMRPVETMARGKHLHVDDLIVAAEWRERRIGMRLLEFAEEYASDHGLRAVFVDSRQEAIGFYKKLGFTFHTAPLMRKGLPGEIS